ncbi:MAG: Mfa1 fimbrilin C-terminal domain-containing protein [Bacteroidaceae bacterium]|nr:Mfa1 fimbrilin C-terminal domain-containing protein [Bacteroidaceae bacterium]
MKFNRVLLGILCAGMFASCANDDTENNNVSFPTEVEKSYIAVNVKSNHSVTRAENGGFDKGSTKESNVASVHFFFFAADGSAFPINAGTLKPGEETDKNYYVKNITTSSSTGNVEAISETVIVLQNAKGKLPEKLVAVVNWDYSGGSLSLSQLQDELVVAADASTDNNFVMSNSIYLSNGEVVSATPISLENIATNQETALTKPVEVYVERVAAKVSLLADNTKFDTGVDFNGKDVYAVVSGWSLNTTMSHSSLIKNIETSWSNTTTPGFVWNDEANRRSYWTKSIPTSSTVTLSKSFKLVDVNANVGASRYCLENTADAGVDNSNNTKVLVAAKFVVDENTPVEIVQLLGDYMTIDGLKNSIANSLSAYYYEDGNNKVKLAPEHIQLVASTKNSYEMNYRLTDAAESLNWHKSNDNGHSFVAETAANINDYMATFHAAKIWKDGGYYFVNVEHLKDGLAGVVRNHSYQITVEDIKGLGTPVYDGNVVIPNPVRPTDDESFIAARVNVLSWQIVKQNVTLN